MGFYLVASTRPFTHGQLKCSASERSMVKIKHPSKDGRTSSLESRLFVGVRFPTAFLPVVFEFAFRDFRASFAGKARFIQT